MARTRSSLVAIALAALTVAVALRAAGHAFLPMAKPVTPPQHVGALSAAVVGAAFGQAAPAFAEEGGGLLNFGKVELGGGFALNLDIPETGIVNIAVLIGGLLYLLGPLLSNSMESREKEITQDIEDAITKYTEASGRLAEAEKAQAQAAEVVAEIEASIAKDQAEFKEMIESQTKTNLEKQAAATELSLKTMEDSASTQVENYISQQAIVRGIKEPWRRTLF